MCAAGLWEGFSQCPKPNAPSKRVSRFYDVCLNSLDTTLKMFACACVRVNACVLVACVVSACIRAYVSVSVRVCCVCMHLCMFYVCVRVCCALARVLRTYVGVRTCMFTSVHAFVRECVHVCEHVCAVHRIVNVYAITLLDAPCILL